jgi:hypothetical protein
MKAILNYLYIGAEVIFQQQQNATGIITYYWTLKKEGSKLTVISYSIVKYNNLPYI